MLPSLPPDLCRLRRDLRTVQLGVNPPRAVLLEFADPAVVPLLDLLDGTRTEEQVLTEAVARLRITPATATAVLGTLRAAGVLVDARTLLPPELPEDTRARMLAEAAAVAYPQPPPGDARTPEHGSAPGDGPTPAEAIRRRAVAKVLVTGAGTLVAPIAIALAGAGVGHIDPVVDGVARPPGLLATITGVRRGTRVAPVRPGAATLVVRVGDHAPAVGTGRGRRAAVLHVAVRDGVVLVGPLVRPAGSPCTRCLELHRRDRDPGWPVLAAQLAAAPSGTGCALTTALAGAAFAAEEVLGYLDGRAGRTDGAAFEISRPGEVRRRSWPTHPRCDCHRRRSPCRTR